LRAVCVCVVVEWVGVSHSCARAHSYLLRKARNGVHGNNVELQAVGELYNRPVEVCLCIKRAKVCCASHAQHMCQVYRDDAAAPANLFHAEYATANAPLRLSYGARVWC
jgi:hypothetical protein